MSNYPEESTLPGATPIARRASVAPGDGATPGEPTDAPAPALLQRAGALIRGGVAPRPADAAPTTGMRTFGHVGRWEWSFLAAVLAAAAALNFIGLAKQGYANTYYAATVRSMMLSWHNFFFASFDPGGFVTVDKPPAGFWVQTISAKIFGFHGWSLLLPQALAGILSVALLWWLVRRAWGPIAGLVAGLALAVTPISVVTNRNNTIDSLLVLCVLGAAWALTRAIESPHHPLRWLLLAATLVGIGFNIKMLEAYLVLPALWLAYLVVARPRWYLRVAHLALATVVLLAVSLSWATAVDLTPEDQRPYVGSSQTNSVLELAFGYNGLQRLLGRTNRNDTSLGSILTTVTAQQAGGGAAGGVGGVSENGPKGLLRLLNQQLGGQIGWTIPLAVLGLFAAAWQVRPRHLRFWRPTPKLAAAHGGGLLRRRRASLLIWGMWFLTMAVFFSYAGFYHRYYLSMLAPGVAALVGLGAAGLWLAWRARGWVGLLGLVLPLVFVGTALVQRRILAPYPEWSARLALPILAVSSAAAAVLALAWLLRRWAGRWAARSAQVALIVGLVGLLVTPAVWSGISVQAASQGLAANLPAAGPNGGGGFGGGGQPRGGNTVAPPAAVDPAIGSQGGGNQPRTGGNGATTNRQPNATGGATTTPGGPTGFPGFPGGNAAVPGGQGNTPPFAGGALPQGFGGGQLSGQLLQWLIDHQGNARYLVAVSSSMQASSVIIERGLAVMATGGFSGGDPILTAESLTQLVQNGTVRYFLGGGNGNGGGGFGGGTTNFNVNTWVSQHCTAVPATQWGGTGTSQLYDCGAAK